MKASPFFHSVARNLCCDQYAVAQPADPSGGLAMVKPVEMAQGDVPLTLEQRVAGPSVMTTIRNSFLLLVFHPESKAL